MLSAGYKTFPLEYFHIIKIVAPTHVDADADADAVRGMPHRCGCVLCSACLGNLTDATHTHTLAQQQHPLIASVYM